MGIAAIRIISESEIATVKDGFNLQWAKDNPKEFNEMLSSLGFDLNYEVELQEGLTHRNSFNAVVTCARWVGQERIDHAWISSKYCSQEAKDRASGSRMLEDLYRQKGMTE